MQAASVSAGIFCHFSRAFLVRNVGWRDLGVDVLRCKSERISADACVDVEG